VSKNETHFTLRKYLLLCATQGFVQFFKLRLVLGSEKQIDYLQYLDGIFKGVCVTVFALPENLPKTLTKFLKMLKMTDELMFDFIP
jgi:hypothetical protein